MIIRTLLPIAFALLVAVSSARGQSLAANSPNSESEKDLLAREVDDPTAILTQLKLQDLYTPRNFQTTAQTNTFQLRPVIPVESFTLFPIQVSYSADFRSTDSSHVARQFNDHGIRRHATLRFVHLQLARP
jgi:hypothetical protein